MRRTPLWLFAFSAALFMLASPGVLNNPDSATRFFTAISLARTGSIVLDGPDMERFETTRDTQGRWVEYFSEGQSVMLAPAIAPLVWCGASRRVLEFFVSALVLPLTSALTLPCFWMFLRLFCRDERINLVACLLLGLSTCTLVYAYNGHHEAQIQVFLIVHCYALVRWFRGDGERFLVLAGAALGAIVWFRPNLVYYGPIAVGWILLEARRSARGAAETARAVGVLTLVSLLVFSPQMGFNYLKTGHPLRLPYGQGNIGLAWQLSGSWLEGAHACFFSAGKSIFLFNPVTLLSAVLALALLPRLVRQPFAPAFAYGLANGLFTLHLVYWTSRGEISWGPRFFVHTTFLMVLPVWYALRVLHRRWLWTLVTLCLVLGAGVQLLGTLYASELDYGAVRVSAAVYGEAPDMNQLPILYWRAGDLARLASARSVFVPERFTCLPDSDKYFVPQWWWVRLLHDPRYGVPAPAVIAVVVVLLALLGASAWQLARSVSTDAPASWDPSQTSA